MSTEMLTARGVDVTLSGRRVLTDVNLTVRAGELVGLVGPNGAGKTTLLRTLLGLLTPQRGQVRLHDADGRGLNPANVDGRGVNPANARGRIGYVPQKHNVDWDFPISVLDAVLHGRTPVRGWLRPARAEDVTASVRALKLVGLDALRDRPIAELSGGQRQRVLIARALSTQPSVLLLDEPFTGVDSLTQEVLLDVLADQRARGVAIVMTTHDLPQMLEHCTRAVLVNGGIYADDTPAQVATSPEIETIFGHATAHRLAVLAEHAQTHSDFESLPVMENRSATESSRPESSRPERSNTLENSNTVESNSAMESRSAVTGNSVNKPHVHLEEVAEHRVTA